MRIGIDIRTVCGERDGKGIYTFNIVKNILDLDKKNEYILFSKEKPLGFDEYKNAKIYLVKSMSIFWHFKVASLLNNQFDIFFSPTSYIIPSILNRNVKSVVVVHDLVALLFPQNHNRKAVFVEKFLLKNIVKKASKILTVSKNTKNDLEEKFLIEAGDIKVINCGVDSDFHILNTSEKRNAILSKRYPRKFILAVGTIIPRKNYSNLIKAFARFSIKNKGYELVIVGGKGWGSKKITNLINRLQVEDIVRMYGYASKQDLIEMYNLAKCFIFPSLYEGFGMPPLEAMSCGCPVISSNTSSLPEVVGNAALKVDPNSVDELKKALEVIVTNKKVVNDLVERGKKNLNNFSWEDSAKKVLEVFNELR